MSFVTPEERTALPQQYASVTPTDATTLPFVAKWFMVPTSGDVAVRGPLDAATTVITGCVPGVQYWGMFSMIEGTNTTVVGDITIGG